MADSFGLQYDNMLMTLAGIVTEGNAIYNYDKSGNPLAFGSPLLRDFRWKEYESYAQDSWKITRNLTLTYGVRWTLLQQPAESKGEQVGPCVVSGSGCTPLSLTDWLNDSALQGKTGGAAINAPHISFAPNGRYNGKSDFWNYEYHDFAPRLAVAWAPDFGSGWLAKIFGSKGQTSIRGGYSIFYNHFGAATVNSYDAAGSYGLSSQVSNVPGTVSVASAPRFTSLTRYPARPAAACASRRLPGHASKRCFRDQLGRGQGHEDALLPRHQFFHLARDQQGPRPGCCLRRQLRPPAPRAGGCRDASQSGGS